MLIHVAPFEVGRVRPKSDVLLSSNGNPVHCFIGEVSLLFGVKLAVGPNPTVTKPVPDG